MGGLKRLNRLYAGVEGLVHERSTLMSLDGSTSSVAWLDMPKKPSSSSLQEPQSTTR